MNIEVQQISHSDTGRVLRFCGVVDATLNFDASLGQLFRNGERILPVVTLPRRFQRQGWEFFLPDLGPTHRFLFEVDWLLSAILVFRCFVNLGLVYEDRDSGQTVVRGSRLALYDYPLAAAAPGAGMENLPWAAGEKADDKPVES